MNLFLLTFYSKIPSTLENSLTISRRVNNNNTFFTTFAQEILETFKKRHFGIQTNLIVCKILQRTVFFNTLNTLPVAADSVVKSSEYMISPKLKLLIFKK